MPDSLFDGVLLPTAFHLAKCRCGHLMTARSADTIQGHFVDHTAATRHDPDAPHVFVLHVSDHDPKRAKLTALTR